jgi:hypothetical protein
VFSAIERQRDIARQKGGRFVCIFRQDENDQRFLGSAGPSAMDRLDLVTPGASLSVEHFNLYDRGWYQSDILRTEPIWSRGAGIDLTPV